MPPASDASCHCGNLMAEPQLNQTVLVLKFQTQDQLVALYISKNTKSSLHTDKSFFLMCPQCLDHLGEAEMQPVRDPQILGAVIWPSDSAPGHSPRLGMCSAACCSPAVPACNNIYVLNGNAITLPAAGNISHQGTASSGKPISEVRSG